jgi:hypothetical protein
LVGAGRAFIREPKTKRSPFQEQMLYDSARKIQPGSSDAGFGGNTAGLDFSCLRRAMHAQTLSMVTGK